MEPDGDSHSLSNFDRQMREMKDRIAGLIELTLAERETNRLRHLLVMEEINGLIELQKEHRVDIMVLFSANKDLRETFQKYFDKK